MFTSNPESFPGTVFVTLRSLDKSGQIGLKSDPLVGLRVHR